MGTRPSTSSLRRESRPKTPRLPMQRLAGTKYDEAVGDPVPIPPAALLEASRRLEMPDLRGGAELLPEQERGDRGVCAEPAVWARREYSDLGPEGAAYLRWPGFCFCSVSVWVFLAMT
ncbi:uncharacterized protein A4U43_C07F10770 [Asparagus officinalis]|uniref:Uncharacterized protein n=1 Tax=Asparagus officinalis TaxID=4686 RepID=A0A5P1EG44_ASPOF|nr:uncharacterized protein A4U43_C07F10770 [Asparagus officinalis]